MSNRGIGLTGADPWSLLQLLDLAHDEPTVPGRSLHQLLAACISPSAFTSYVVSHGGSAGLAAALFAMADHAETGGLPLDETLARLDPGTVEATVARVERSGGPSEAFDLAESLEDLRAALAGSPAGRRL